MLRPALHAVCAAILLFAASAAPAQTIVRQLAQAPGADLLVGARVPPGTDLLFLSGKIAAVADPKASRDSTAAYGDMQQQTANIFTKIAATLAHHAMGIGDIVKLTVYLVGDPAHGGAVDRAGFLAGYHQFFGTADQPNLPARTIVQVAGLDTPGYLVAVDVIAAKAPAR